MFGYQIGFNQPWYLLLLAALPVLWVMSYRSLAGLGSVRKWFAIGLRTIVLAIFVLALAEVQWQKVSDRLTVFYLLDQSESIPRPIREAMLQYVVKEVQLHRRRAVNGQGGDRPGVIIFGREAMIESPPFDSDIRTIGRLESIVDLRSDATNIAAALKQAQASFPEDTAKRVVIVTDGNENVGDARTIARTMAEQGIGIDVVPIYLRSRAETAVEAVRLPPDIRRGQPTEIRVVVNNYLRPGDEEATKVAGRLRVTMNYARQEQLLAEEQVTLEPGKNVFKFQHTIEVPSSYTFRADFIPDDAAHDLMQQNNTATAFTHVRGKGRILFIEDFEQPGEFARLIDALGKMNLEVEIMRSNQLYSSLAELQGFDCVILADVPRAGGGSGDSQQTAGFGDDQIQMLVRNTEQMGCGLIMLGGPRSFGAGGWTNTELEKSMPVDFQIKNANVRGVGALAMMMHASEMAEGNHWQKVIGEEALKVLGPEDYCGVIHWDDFTGKDNWLWGQGKGGIIKIQSQQKTMLARMAAMAPGDMPAFDPALQLTYNSFVTGPSKAASVKQAIIISDGDPTPPTPALLAKFKAAQIPISTVAVGTHGPAGSTPLQNIAATTGGKYYVVTNAKALPRIFQIEARKVARPLIYEPDGGVKPQVVYRHEMLQDIDNLPATNGFVLTTLKDSPLVEVAIRSPKPTEPENSTILAGWTYGAGRTVAFTTDAGARWTKDWTEWSDYDRFFGQMVRWAMRPVNQDGKFLVSTEYRDGKVRVVVNARDKEDEYLNFLNISAAGSGPEMENVKLQLRQEGPGRYVGEFDADKAGSYLLALSPGRDYAPVLAGVTVPYSSEFRERESNEALLTTMSGLTPRGATEPGKFIDGDLAAGEIEKLTEINTFRPTLPKALSSHDAWPAFLVLAAAVFFSDVFIRRVHVHFQWLWPLLAAARSRLTGRAPADDREVRLERLRNLKAQMSGEIESRRAATRFEPQAEDTGRSLTDAMSDAGAAGGPADAARPTSAPTTQADAKDETTYTERLLEAKRKAKKDP